MRHSLRRALLPITLLALLAGFAVVPASGASGVLLVGYAPGASLPAAAASAGEVVALDATLGLAILDVQDVGAAEALLRGAPGVAFVERDGVALADGARTDSARWDSARWDSARWDSSRWDSSRWDSSRWDSSRWDSSRWDALLLDSSRWDSSRWDSSRWDSSRWDSSRWDGAPLVEDPLLAYQWGLADMNVPEAWAVTMGEMRRTLCVVDSGIEATHPDLAPQLSDEPGRNFVGEPDDLTDRAGHGTHVAGVAAAAIGNGYGTAGVANAEILAVKVLNDQGIGGLGALAQGIRYCADHGADVISLSLSTQQDSQAVRRAVEHAQEKGALLVASAGAPCDGCAIYPAAYDGVLGVAAIDMTRAPAAFSAQGAHVDLAAPGELIAGPFLDGTAALGTGTSQATALAAGAALLVWDHDTSLTAAQVAERLTSTAQDLGAPGWEAATGHGEVDVLAALG